MVKFCPKCFHPLEASNETSDDDGRLCEICRWFGDKSEVLDVPPPPSSFELGFIQMLALFRDVCRLELLAEQLTEHVGKLTPDVESTFKPIITVMRKRVDSAKHSLIYLFRSAQSGQNKERDK